MWCIDDNCRFTAVSVANRIVVFTDVRKNHLSRLQACFSFNLKHSSLQPFAAFQAVFGAFENADDFALSSQHGSGNELWKLGFAVGAFKIYLFNRFHACALTCTITFCKCCSNSSTVCTLASSFIM